MESAGDDLSTLAWSMAGNRPIMNTGKVLAKTPISEAISKQLKLRGFKYVGPVVVYAWMQATGIANDHVAGCFRRPSTRRTTKTSNVGTRP
jgi:DNA-3-methyladenine glycosylase I